MTTIGVIVGRFQADELHDAHRALIAEVQKLHPKVLLFLGCTPVKMSAEDPLDYQTRERMMRDEFPDVVTAAIEDRPTDEEWSRQLDESIGRMFPLDSPVLYGSRDSFVPHYRGKHRVVELPAVSMVSATQLRERVASRPQNSRDFRAGVIYACANRYPVSYPTVDIAILRTTAGVTEVLLGRKGHDDALRFPGGFVDPADESLERAARREASEETGLEIGTTHYVGSCGINDWRYRNRKDRIITTLFAAPYIFGIAKGNDDLLEVEWISTARLPEVLIKEHQPLGEMLMKFLANQAT